MLDHADDLVLRGRIIRLRGCSDYFPDGIPSTQKLADKGFAHDRNARRRAGVTIVEIASCDERDLQSLKVSRTGPSELSWTLHPVHVNPRSPAAVKGNMGGCRSRVHLRDGPYLLEQVLSDRLVAIRRQLYFFKVYQGEQAVRLSKT